MRASDLAPALGIGAGLALLAASLDHGLDWGLGRGALDVAGRVYFALLLLAPLVVYPLAWRAGLAGRTRVALSLLPGFLWWLTEIPVRLAGHSPAEALWLVMSPVNLAHLYLVGVAVAFADLGCRMAVRLRGGAALRRTRVAAAATVLALLLGPLAVLGSIPVFLNGYRALFQQDLLPRPESFPGPLAEGRSGPGTPRDALPNVVFILSDDHRWDFAGHAGHPFAETPALDRLAAEGVRFERAYVTSSLCSPSRASFLTGMHPHRHGVWNNFTPWSDRNRTFLEYLSRAGYATAFIGKWHMPGGLPELRGVDHFVTFTNLGGQGRYEWCPLVVDGQEEPSRTRYIATELTDRALAWLGANHERPFALVLSHKNVHAGFTPDEPDRGSAGEVRIAWPPGAHPWTHMLDAQYTHLSFAPLDDLVRRYAEAIRSMDREIDRVLRFLDARGLAHDTLVVYASDNGYLWGEHGLVDKRWAYEESIRIPLLVRFPASGHAPGTLREQLVANIDLAPTLLDLAGVAIPERMQGRSWLPLLRGPDSDSDSDSESDPAAAFRESLLYSYFFEPPYPTPSIRALVTSRYKYVESDGRPPELFDLEADPREQRNLLDDGAPPVAGRLARELEAAWALVR
ncbi:MAG: sulfatase-like hydrolase/transferase [Myxococcota bacterium]